jgi:aminoglycoside 3-N-acetyltransferase
VKDVFRKAKQRCFPKGVRRTANSYINRLIHRATRKSLAAAFSELRLKPGAVICMHSALSALGYLVEGPESVIFALQEAVPGCTIMMPSFPFGETTLKYISADPIYDPVHMPSMSGLLTESMRIMRDTRRSLHPTHPCIALGPAADELIKGSELSETPFGNSSTYGRFSRRDDAVLLLIHTNNTSIVHRFQEIIDMPNLFLPDSYRVRGLDAHGAVQSYSLRVHNPLLPLYVAVARRGEETEYVWFPDYVVQFPADHETQILDRITDAAARQFIKDRQSSFYTSGVFRTARHGQAELLAIRVKPWQDRICQDLRSSLARFGESYRLQTLREAKEKGLLIH